MYLGNQRFGILSAVSLAFFATLAPVGYAQPASSAPSAEIKILEIQGTVEVFPAGAKTWTPATAGQVLHAFDRIHTADNSRVALRWSDQSVVPFGAATELEILPPSGTQDEPGLHLVRGILSFFHRDQPGRIRIITRGAAAGVEGTEFVLAVNDVDTTTLSVIDGKVRFGNDQTTLLLTNGQQAVEELGKAPVSTPGFIANNLLQWCFYYPAVLELNDVPFTSTEQTDLAASLAAYRSGDLLPALALYPTNRTSVSPAETIYHSALLLAVGQVAPAESSLDALDGQHSEARIQALSTALRQLIAAVKHQANPSKAVPTTATECLAASYYEQSSARPEISLRTALQLARQATTNAPKSGFAWTRVAELELCFGRQKAAWTALETSLALAPRNAQALALKGFILAARNEPRTAILAFNEALTVDAALGNAWLGRGVCRIQLGEAKAGREDLLVAAALEPQRSELRSYLGKAFLTGGDQDHATKELNLAKQLDPQDPTPWLYSALQNQRNNDINDGIRDLEKSKALNGNRSVYRSQLLLDEDQAVRSANLASLYHDAGMEDVAVREAGKAVSYDYANYSAHLFLAGSYEQLRDPNWSNLRYETPAVSEFWIANLLAPTSAGWLGFNQSGRPYAQMFSQNRAGFFSDSTYLERGAFSDSSGAYYTSSDFSAEADASYQYDPGQRPNNDFVERGLNVNVKGQLTPQDSVFLTVQGAWVDSGDENQYYSQSSGSRSNRTSEKQLPNLYLGYHHEWSPGAQTLLMFGLTDQAVQGYAPAANHNVFFTTGGAVAQTGILIDNTKVNIDPTLYSIELQQIWETSDHTTVIGSRYQWGQIHYRDFESGGGILGSFLFPNPSDINNQDLTVDDQYLTVYGYHRWQLLDPLSVELGISCDWEELPADVVSSPFSAQTKEHSQLSPKAGVIWTPLTNTTFRAAYTRSLMALANGQSERIEPTSVAGFNQAFRGVMPDALAGDSSGAGIDTYDISMEQYFATETYLRLGGELLYSKLDRLSGQYIANADSPLDFFTSPGWLNESLRYREVSLFVTIDQLFGKEWTVGGGYHLSQAKYEWSLNNIPADLGAGSYYDGFVNKYTLVRSHQRSLLHNADLHINWNHRSGFFSRLELDWFHQSNSYDDQLGFTTAQFGDDFWQFNAYVGYRFWERRAELTAGLLNVFDQNYQLDPLNIHNEMAHSRTFMARLKINF